MTTIDIEEQLGRIKHFVFDVDGVMTDGTVGCLESGEMYRTFNVRDGYAMERAYKAGYRICVITGGNQLGVRKRLDYLHIKDVFMGSGAGNKIDIFEKYLADNQIDESSLVYMGDDMPDLEVLSRPMLLSTAPADAIEDIVRVVKWRSKYAGGKGAVREIIELVMRKQGTW